LKEFKKIKEDFENKIIRKEKQHIISQMWVVKAKNFLTEKPIMPTVEKKAVESAAKDPVSKHKAIFSKDNIAESTVKDGMAMGNSKNNLHSTVGTTDLQLFEGKRARIAREKATLTTICQLLKNSQHEPFSKSGMKRADETPIISSKKPDPKFSNKSISFTQRSCEVTASQITKKFSKAIFNTNLN
jgi:hypothetical protein